MFALRAVLRLRRAAAVAQQPPAVCKEHGITGAGYSEEDYRGFRRGEYHVKTVCYIGVACNSLSPPGPSVSDEHKAIWFL